MGRLLLFLELAAAACAVGFFSLWGTVSPALAITPIAIVVFIPLVAALGVWPPRVLARALLDGWGSDPLRKPAPQSAAIWRFLERMVPLSGAIGVGIFAVLTLSFIPVGGPGEAATTIARRASSLIGLCGADAAGVFLVIRAVRQTVDLLQRRETTGAASKLPEAALSRYSISERESEVAVLLLSGLRYDEIADRLFISTKTVKTHVHRLYQKTEPGTGWSWPSAFAPEPAAGAGCGAPWRRDATPVRRRGPAPRRKRPQKGRILQTEY